MPYAPHRPLNVGHWWRFSRYEIRGGYICPAPNARLSQYDPWTATEQKGRPFESLLKLMHGIDYDLEGTFVNSATGHGEVNMPALTPAATERILNWCARYGLLGIALQQMRALVLAPRWARSFTTKRLPRSWMGAELRHYVRTSGSWYGGTSVGAHRNGVTEGDLVPSDLWSSRWPKPGCYVDTEYPVASTRHQGFEGLAVLPLRETWAHFTLGVPPGDEETYDYATPYSSRFWREYGEAVIDFLGAAQTLSRGLEALKVREQRAGIEVSPQVVRARGRRILDEFLAATNPVVLEEPEGNQRIVFRSPSLLGMMAVMAAEDVATGGSMQRCANERCQTSFVTTSRRERYCSARCRSTAEQGKYREAQRDLMGKRLAAVLPKSVPLAARDRIVRSLARKYQSAQRLGQAARIDGTSVSSIIKRHAPGLASRDMTRALQRLSVTER